ncbi:MAG TPA: oligosaccharide flippase family protein, partial [Polyangiaceae bacterium]|nr:oligosaccharide flippase family protein [Polyangiaceae bacterium]
MTLDPRGHQAPAVSAASPLASRVALWSVVDSVTGSVFSTGTYLVMTWFVSGTEFGVAMLALAVAQTLSAAVESLFLDYVVSRPELTREQLGVFHGATMLVAAILAAALVCVAPALELALGAPGLGHALQALSFIILCSGLSAVPLACLKRDLAFATLARRTVVVRILACLLGLWLAHAKAGLWAVIGQQLALSLANTLVLLFIRPLALAQPLQPAILRPALSFVAGGFLPGLIAGNINRLLTFAMGFVAGPQDVAFVGMAARILDALTFPVLGGLGQVTLPILARARARGYPIAETYRKAATITTAIAMPVFFGLAVSAMPFTGSFLAARWAPTGAFLTLLAVERGLRVQCATNAALLTALGRTPFNLKISVVDLCTGMLLLYALRAHGPRVALVGWCLKAAVYIPISTLVTAYLARIS